MYIVTNMPLETEKEKKQKWQQKYCNRESWAFYKK